MLFNTVGKFLKDVHRYYLGEVTLADLDWWLGVGTITLRKFCLDNQLIDVNERPEDEVSEDMFVHALLFWGVMRMRQPLSTKPSPQDK